MAKAKFFKPVQLRTFSSNFIQIDDNDPINFAERGLDDFCEEGDKHHRLLFPKESGQKHYCMCMKCFEHSHL